MNCKFLETIPSDLKTSFDQAKASLVMASSVVSYLMYSCSFYFTEDDIPHKTAYARVTEKENQIVMHVDFWRSCNPQVRAFVLYHECLHLFLNHGARGIERGYMRENWGKATDYNINSLAHGHSVDGHGKKLTDERIRKYLSVPDWVLFEDRFVGKSADEIYFILEKEDKQSGGSGGGKGKVFDDVMPSESISKERQEKNIRILQSAAIAASMNKHIGSSDADLVRMIEQMTKVEIPWYDYLTTVIARSRDSGSSYSRYNRKSTDEVIFPAKTETDSIRVVFGIDTSGSMSDDDYSECAGALYNLVKTYDNYDVTLLSCDTEAHVIGHYTNDDEIDFSKLNFKLIGGGGTDMFPMIKMAEDFNYDEQIDAVIIGTDGHIPTSQIEYFPTEFKKIFVVTKSGNKNLFISGSEIIHVN
jgi:predicted metal-dependent peptidase